MLSALTALIEPFADLISGLASLVPRLQMVHRYQMGVRWRAGHKAIEALPGWHFYWPLTTEFEVLDMRPERMEVDLNHGDTRYVYSIEFEIEDAVAYTSCRQNPENVIDHLVREWFASDNLDEDWLLDHLDSIGVRLRYFERVEYHPIQAHHLLGIPS